MAEEQDAPDLLDLKFLPAWLKETPNKNAYADYLGEEEATERPREHRGFERHRERDRQRGPKKPRRPERARGLRVSEGEPRSSVRPPEMRSATPAGPRIPLKIRFVPDGRIMENVLAQIKAGHLAYSVFSLARMFLDKPERYDVALTTEANPLFQIGENGQVSTDRRIVEGTAFLEARDSFYQRETTQTEPIKGNFTSVARCRLSGTLLGPTNYHAYQSQLRNLYEQRFSRRMSFPEYQRQIEIVADPEAVERWKEESRKVTTYNTLQEEAPLSFQTSAEAERHFRQAYLPALVRSATQLTVDGVVSRRLADRSLGRAIEDAWAQEFRSPAKMMQELSGAFRHNALQIFRHRKGMLFVTPIRARPFSHGSSSVSSSVAGILEALAASPGMNRRQLLEKLQPEGLAEEEYEKRKLMLASDLHWLVSEGHLIEFNDGALDLPRIKTAAPEPAATPPAPNGKISPSTLPNESKSGEAAAELSEPEAVEGESGSPIAEPSTADAAGLTSESSENPRLPAALPGASESPEATSNLPLAEPAEAKGELTTSESSTVEPTSLTTKSRDNIPPASMEEKLSETNPGPDNQPDT